TAAGRSRDPGYPSLRARLCVRPHAARRLDNPARPRPVLAQPDGGEPRPCAVVPSAVPRRRVAPVRAGEPERLGRPRFRARTVFYARRHPGGVGRAGRPGAGTAPATLKKPRTVCSRRTIPTARESL